MLYSQRSFKMKIYANNFLCQKQQRDNKWIICHYTSKNYERSMEKITEKIPNTGTELNKIDIKNFKKIHQSFRMHNWHKICMLYSNRFIWKISTTKIVDITWTTQELFVKNVKYLKALVKEIMWEDRGGEMGTAKYKKNSRFRHKNKYCNFYIIWFCCFLLFFFCGGGGGSGAGIGIVGYHG